MATATQFYLEALNFAQVVSIEYPIPAEFSGWVQDASYKNRGKMAFAATGTT